MVSEAKGLIATRRNNLSAFFPAWITPRFTVQIFQRNAMHLMALATS